jgi:hypothetical protein
MATISELTLYFFNDELSIKALEAAMKLEAQLNTIKDKNTNIPEITIINVIEYAKQQKIFPHVIQKFPCMISLINNSYVYTDEFEDILQIFKTILKTYKNEK